MVFACILLATGPAPTLAQRAPASRTFERLSADAERARAEDRVDDAIPLYADALKLDPSWAPGWYYLGSLLYERDAYPDAAKAFERTTALTPKAGAAWAMLGLCEFKLERFDAALAHILRARTLGIGEPSIEHVAVYHQGLLLLGTGEFERAQEALDELGHAGVEDDNLVTALGLAVLRLRFSELLGGDSTLRDVVHRAGVAEQLAAQKKFAEALVEYERLAADFPTTPNVQYALGRHLLEVNEDERAVAAFVREIENSPSHVPARVEIADTKFRLRDFAGGLPYAEDVVKLAPRYPLGHFLLGALLVEAGQTERAVAELETARAGLPAEPKVYFQLGRAYAAIGRTADAARARAEFTRLTRAQQASPDATPERNAPASPAPKTRARTS